MRVCYVALSPTLGMHQYTADLANKMAGAFDGTASTGWPVAVVASSQAPRDRYAPQVQVSGAIKTTGTGLQRTNLSLRGLYEVCQAIRAAKPDVVHFTGPHLWNPALLLWLRQAGLPTIHTIHDLDPHSGTGYGRLLYLWNNTVLRWSGHVLVHGETYRKRLLDLGLPEQRVSCTPLLHLFLSYGEELALRQTAPEHQSEPYALFFARLEPYKGIDVLIEAMRQLADSPESRAIIAGKGQIEKIITGSVPQNVEIRNRLLDDTEALDLFQRCSVVVLPYRDATQSALIAAAYFFGKPVIVTRAGALPEYVVDDETGWVVPPGNVSALVDRLRRAFSEPDRLARMGQAGRAWYQTRYRDERNILRLMYARATCKEAAPGEAGIFKGNGDDREC